MIDHGAKVGMVRLDELRAAVEVRRRTMPTYDDAPYVVAEKLAEMPFWEALQAEALATNDREES